MIKVGPPAPVPNHRAAKGTHATGAIKRKASNKGDTMSSSQPNQPISKPSGTPISAARPKPHAKRVRLDAICSCKTCPAKGVFVKSMSLITTSCGIGRNCGGISFAIAAKYQIAKKTVMPINDSIGLLSKSFDEEFMRQLFRDAMASICFRLSPKWRSWLRRK